VSASKQRQRAPQPANEGAGDGGAPTDLNRTPRGDLARLIPVLHDQLPAILAEVRDQFEADWPEYAEFLGQEQGEVTTAARAFLTWLVELADRAGTPADPDVAPHIALFESIGRLESLQGRELSSLLSAYQAGGRIAWRHVSRAALDLDVQPDSLAALAEAVFVFIDHLSSASARGFVWEQSETVAERERRREDLVDLLLSGRSDVAAVRGAAVRAGWALPAEVAVVLTDPDNPIGNTFLSRLDIRSLPLRRPGLVGAIVPDPSGPGRRTQLANVLRGARAVVGHAVPLEQLPASIPIAQIAADLQRKGLLVDDPVFVDRHLDAILVHRDPRLLAALQRAVLAPLDGQAPATRERLVETLRSWLRHFGDRRAIASELHVHPQTVRYRMGQLHTLFGSTLDSPDFRARLMLALAWSGIPIASADPPTPSPAEQRQPDRVRDRPGRAAANTDRRQLPPKRPASRR
jgi:hypothetical protein